MSNEEVMNMVRHKHKFDNVLDFCTSTADRNLQILMCYECQTIKVVYEGKKPKYIRK